MTQEDPKLKLANLILEHPEVNIYFRSFMNFDDMDLVHRVIFNVEFIKGGYMFGGYAYENRSEFKDVLEDSASWDGTTFRAKLFKTKIDEYLSKNQVDCYDDLEEDKADELINSLIDIVEPEDFILVTLEPISPNSLWDDQI